MRRLVSAVAVMLSGGLLASGCSQNTGPIVVRSLERSGKASFVCVNVPGEGGGGIPLDGCFSYGVAVGTRDYRIPHAISLVTQTARGEVALVDVTSQTVLDADKSVPGYTFLPIGQQPTDIVSTPGSNATFVGIGDPVRPGIYALPTSFLPLPENAKAPTMGSWPACALPPGGVPTEMVIATDLTQSASDPGGRRAHCDGSPGSRPSVESKVDLTGEISLFGRPKLVVQLPELGEIDIIDAQDLVARTPGSFEPCTIERRIFLTVDANPPVTPPVADAGRGDATPDAGPRGDASTDDAAFDDAPIDVAPLRARLADDAGTGVADAGVNPDVEDDTASCSRRPGPPAPVVTRPHPYAMALADDGRLFISDDAASVIHVLDLSDPCTATERAPLLPFSAADPGRQVTSGALAVSPLTSDGKRFVYATDIKNSGSIMVFDVSTTSKERTPLLRPDRLFNPVEPPDRIAVPAPVESLTFATQEVPFGDPDPATGEVPRGVLCDPANAEDVNQPAEDFVSAGAGPRRLRGTYAFLAMTNGQMAVVDLDDYDTPCRRPRYTSDPALGCSPDTQIPGVDGLPAASQEVSCNIVERHRLRSSKFFTNVSAAGRNAPAMLSLPVLIEKDGTVVSADSTRGATEKPPKLLGPALVAEEHDPNAFPLLATVTSSSALPNVDLLSNPNDPNAVYNWVTFDLREPRAHFTQNWTVRYEGVLPWFASGRRGRLQCDANKSAIDCESGDDPSHFVLYDSSVGFCDGGAQGADMAPAGDLVEIIDDLPDPADPYWGTVADKCSRQACENVFGTVEEPRTIDANGDPVGRDIVIEKSYQNRLSLRTTRTENPLDQERRVPISCCFPYPVAYALRAHKHWIVSGQVTGFNHHVIPDPVAPPEGASWAACVQSCDPNVQLRTGRVVARSTSEPVPTYDDPAAFRNAQLRFVLWDIEGDTCAAPPCASKVRDRFFSFNEVGGFSPMTFGLSSTSLVMPQSVRYVRGIQKLAIPDPVGMGLMLFDLKRLYTSDSYY